MARRAEARHGELGRGSTFTSPLVRSGLRSRSRDAPAEVRSNAAQVEVKYDELLNFLLDGADRGASFGDLGGPSRPPGS